MSDDDLTPMAGLSWSREESKLIEQWAQENDCSIVWWASPMPQRKENIASHLANGNFFKINNVHGFVVANSSEFKPAILRQLNRVVSRNDFYLYAVDRGSEAFTEEDFAVEESKPKPHNITINIQTNYGSVAGVVEKQIQQINNQLNSVQSEHQEIANALAEITQAIDKSTLPEKDKAQAIERVAEVTEVIAQPIEERRGWKIVERAENLGKFVTGLTTAYEGAEKLRPLVENTIKLIASIFGGT